MGIIAFILSLIIRDYFMQFIFLGTLGVIGYFVYDALEQIHKIHARNLADIQANMEMIMEKQQITKDELVHEKFKKKDWYPRDKTWNILS